MRITLPKNQHEAKVKGILNDKNSGCDGFVNSHAHIDRAFTYDDKYLEGTGKSVSDLATMTLAEKQSLVGLLHDGLAFTEEDLYLRMKRVIEESIAYGTKQIDSAIDTTGSDKVGLRALDVAFKLRREFEGKIKLRFGAYNVFGFRDDEPQRWEVFEEAAQRADFIVGLPERDDRAGHITSDASFWKVLDLGYRLDKEIHFHVGQARDPGEKRTFQLLENLHWLFDVHHRTNGKYPKVKAVHMVSESCYSEEEFDRLTDMMLKYGVSLIVCPTAAVSMKQDRSKIAPVYNSIARAYDCRARGINLEWGSDNISDMFCPHSTADMYDEMTEAVRALRFDNPRTLTRMFCGVKLDGFDIGELRKAFEYESFSIAA